MKKRECTSELESPVLHLCSLYVVYVFVLFLAFDSAIFYKQYVHSKEFYTTFLFVESNALLCWIAPLLLFT